MGSWIVEACGREERLKTHSAVSFVMPHEGQDGLVLRTGTQEVAEPEDRVAAAHLEHRPQPVEQRTTTWPSGPRR
jgi:hypothetical protein